MMPINEIPITLNLPAAVPLGAIQIIEMPIPMMQVQAVRYRNRHTGKERRKRRHQKKWLRKFGTKPAPAITEKEMMRVVVDQRRGRIHAYPPAIEAIMREIDKRNAEAQAGGRARLIADNVIDGKIYFPTTEEIKNYG
jgi:hypothetical protein